MEQYLEKSSFIDFDKKVVEDFVKENSNPAFSQKDNIVQLYYAVRDQIKYDPYHIILDPSAISASQTLSRKYGYCIEKSLVLAAAGRYLGIPSRLGFSIVRNHLATEKFLQLLRSDLFVFHGYNEFFIDEKWVKCTPAFNKELCEKHGTQPLEFDGESDSIFQPFSPDGSAYMEYVHEYGVFADFPYPKFIDELKKYYPHFFGEGGV